MRRLLSWLAAAGVAIALPALAQLPTDHIRGKVKSLSGSSLVIQGKTGKLYNLTMAPGWTVTMVKPC